MIASEQANLSRWTGEGFEIWFFVVLLPASGEGPTRRESAALWVRMTRFADGPDRDARVWAVVSAAGSTAGATAGSTASSVTAERDILPLAALTVEGGDTDGALRLRVGEAELGHGWAHGRCGSIRWSFTYTADSSPVTRLPRLPAFVPLGTHSLHPHAGAPVGGWMEVDGRRVDLDGGLLTQMHLWGTRRVEWLRWLWVPRFVGGGSLELTAVAPRAGARHICALWVALGDGPGAEVVDHTGLLRALRSRVHSVRPGVLHHVTAAPGGRRLVLRAWAPAASFAGWNYRQIGGGDLHVAQSDLAHCELEIYRRTGLGWRPERRLRSTCAALEVHGPDDFAEFAYVPWAAREARAPRNAPTSTPAPGAPPGPGTWIDTPRPPRIVALGLTYRAHASETASAPDPLVFSIDPAAWTTGDGELLRPSSARLLAAATALDPGLATALADFGFMPAMLDYEVELGLVLLDGLDDPRRLDAMAAGRVAWVVANDVTARSLQILGEGQRDRLAYWSASKSLPGFAPTTARAWLPARLDLDAWPALRLQTWVNGVLRQDSALALLLETPRQMLTRVLAATGPLPPNTLLLTGTPAGVAFAVPAWKRALGERLLDRVGKLRAALGGFAATTRFLRPGDIVAVRGGFLGGFVRAVNSED